ncbi:MAG TPA: M23 family metallopeptidase, partial [Gemmatimonadaceae bacterium]|nr:M23 family metallopeptidase [Gemmatimonadaceae bacterium]
VPEGCDAPREVRVSERRLRRLATGAATALLFVVVGGGLAVGRVFASASDVRIASMAAWGQTREAAALRQSLDALRDTLAALGRRDRQLRLAAGLPSGDSSALGEPPRPARGLGSSLEPDMTGTRADVDSLIRSANLLAAGFDTVTSAINRNADKMASTPSIMPTAGWLTSQFSRSRFHPILHMSRPHEGIDVAAPMGAPVVAPAAGRVVFAGVEHGYGNVLQIDHGNGIVTKFAHLSRIGVRNGDRVTRGQTVAAVGNTGLSTGPHLHYEIHVNGRVVDPLTYVIPGAIPD